MRDRRESRREPPRVEGRVPPHNLEAEECTLSAIMVDGTGDAFDKVVDVLRVEHFYSEAHRRIYEACIELRRESKPCDVIMVGGWLKTHERLEQVGGHSFLIRVCDSAPAIARVRDYALMVRDTWLVRQVIVTCQERAAIGYVDYGSVREYVADTAERLAAIAQEDAPDTLFHILPIIKAGLDRATAAARSGRAVSGTATGFERYDRLTAGLHAGDLTIIAARPGMGKTALVLNIAVNVAAGSDEHRQESVGVVIFSLEMPRDQLGNRMACAEGRIDVGKLRGGCLTPKDWNNLTQASVYIGGLPIWIDDSPATDLMSMRAKVRRVQAELARKPLVDRQGTPRVNANGEPIYRKVGLVVLDYLQLMKGREGVSSREQEISEISRGLKGQAKDLGVPIIALSQLNRQVETRSEKNKRPQLSDLRESGAIEQDADNICFIYRDDYYNKENSPERNIAELIIAKQRNGPTGTAKVRFDREYTRFDNLAEGEHPDDEAYG